LPADELCGSNSYSSHSLATDPGFFDKTITVNLGAPALLAATVAAHHPAATTARRA
jgi:hypothetical protein